MYEYDYEILFAGTVRAGTVRASNWFSAICRSIGRDGRADEVFLCRPGATLRVDLTAGL